MLDIIKAFPLFSIICCFVGAVICSFSNRKVAFITSLVVCGAVFTLSVITLSYCMYYDTSFKSSSISASKTYRLAIIDYVFTSTYYVDIFKGIAYKENDILREVVAEAIEQAY